MNMKYGVYTTISRGGDEKIKQANRGKLELWGRNDDEKSMCGEVLAECKQDGFHAGLERYKVPREMVTRSPEILLMHRMAICCLRHKDIHNYSIVVVSVHNYSKRTGKTAPENHAHLLFDFLAKVEAPVVIAGDFNLDIARKDSLEKFLCSYSTEPHQLRPLRQDLDRIDFVCLKDYPPSTFETSLELESTVAHDLHVPPKVLEYYQSQHRVFDEKTITNHNPLSATLVVKTRPRIATSKSSPCTATLKSKTTK